MQKRYKKGSSIEEGLNRFTSAPRSIRKAAEQESAATVGTSRHPIFEAYSCQYSNHLTKIENNKSDHLSELAMPLPAQVKRYRQDSNSTS